MKHLILLLVSSLVSSVSFAEWQLVNEYDPIDDFDIYVDFHNVEALANGRYQLPMRTSTLPQSSVTTYSMPLYEPYTSAMQIIDCNNQTITTHSQKIFAKIAPSASFIDVLATFNSANANDDEYRTRDLSKSDMVDTKLSARLCSERE
ncbi:hypothetical protein [Psychrobacter pygoscelis]|uniref:hypothetical protein n=1 Tax=Psychrobacter pygoscelis TaxID=2488563 RepID=UPI001040607A|nr:hypothetical protein [Psychrobacter pygoscelis]